MKTFDDYLSPAMAPKNCEPDDPFHNWMVESQKKEKRDCEPYAGEFGHPMNYDWEADQKYYEAEREINRAINSGAATTNFGKRCTR